MKVLVVSDTYFPKMDGVTRFISEVVPRLAKDFEITMLVPSYSKKKTTETYKGATVIHIPITRLRISDYHAAKIDIITMIKQIRKNDLIFVQSGIPLGAMAMVLGKRFKKPVITYVHQIAWEQLSNMITRTRVKKVLVPFIRIFSRFVLNRCNALIVPSMSVAETMKNAGVETKKTIVKLGVNNEDFIPPKDKESAKKKLKIKPETVVIGYCGRISAEKDVETLIDAFKEVKKRHDVKLLLVGGGKKSYVDSLKSKDMIITGFQESVVDYLQAMDIFVMPSLTETSSLSTMEAMSCGLPVIATPVGHIREYINSGHNGYLFPREHTGILVKKLEKLISNPDLRKAFGMTARKTMIGYDWETTAGKIKSVILMFKSSD